MNVAFNPSVNFTDTNLISEASRKALEEKNQAAERRYQINEPFDKPIEEVIEMPASVSQPSSDKFEKELSDAELNEKAFIFSERLKNRKWKKEYLPENDIIIIRQKHVNDGLAYMLKNDGTVLETGLKDKPVTIIDPSIESAKTFAKYKKKLDPNAPKTSLWMKFKEATANVWKFFTVAGTMGVATAKGLWQGALTGAAVFASATIIKGIAKVIKKEITVSDIFTHPLKTGGKTGKLLAFAAGALVLTGHLVAGKLQANQKSAVIEHKIDVPHVD